jgi:branched-chain amino acid transport system ATP-binding protein
VTQPLLQVQDLGKRFGGFVALEGVSLSVAPGERLGLIGPNGSGKSTFVNCLGGALARHDGVVVFGGRDLAGLPPYRRVRLGLARTFQLPRAFASLTVLENVEVPFRFLDPRGGPTSERAWRLLERVGLGRKARFRPRDLTQVDLRRLELARALACQPKLLLADETMAGLSHAEVDDILELLFRANADGVAVVMIEHIMRAVTTFSERLVVFVAGRAIADGPTQEILRRKDVEAAYLGE